MDKSCLCWQYVKSCLIQRHNCRHTSCQLHASECILLYVSPRKWPHTATVPMVFSQQKSIYSHVLVFKITWHKHTNHIWEELNHSVLRISHNAIFEQPYTIPQAVIRSITVSMNRCLQFIINTILYWRFVNFCSLIHWGSWFRTIDIGLLCQNPVLSDYASLIVFLLYFKTIFDIIS